VLLVLFMVELAAGLGKEHVLSMRATAVWFTLATVLLLLASGTDATTATQCIVLSEAWRGPWTNGTPQAYQRGREFFDNSIGRCNAFGGPCEEWIEFHGNRGQIQCMHDMRPESIYKHAWDHAKRAFHRVTDRPPTANEEQQHNADTMAVESPVAVDHSPETPPLVGVSFDHVQLHAPEAGVSNLGFNNDPTSEDTADRLRRHRQECDATHPHSVECRLVATGPFRRFRTGVGADGNRERHRHGTYLFDMYEWECRAMPQWTHIVGARPVCPPFYPVDTTNVCIPIEDCYVLIDPVNSKPLEPYHLLLLSVLLMLFGLCGVYWLYRRGRVRRRSRCLESGYQRTREEEQTEMLMSLLSTMANESKRVEHTFGEVHLEAVIALTDRSARQGHHDDESPIMS